MKKKTMFYALEIIRAIAGFSAGLFSSKMVFHLAEGKSLPKQVGYWLGGCAMGLGAGSGIDYMVNRAEIDLGVRDKDLLLTSELMDELTSA